MKSVKELIKQNLDRYADFDYYLERIEEINRDLNIKPDVCIENSKSLVEGISKTILKHLDKSFAEKHIDGMKAEDVFERATKKLAEYDANLDLELIEKLKAVLNRVVKIRNNRGDISHGKLVPKLENSDKNLALFIFNMAESLAFYLLSTFYSINIVVEEIIAYDKISDFNDELDSEIELDGVIYSKALYEQDYILYCEKLEEFIERKKQEIEE